LTDALELETFPRAYQAKIDLQLEKVLAIDARRE